MPIQLPSSSQVFQSFGSISAVQQKILTGNPTGSSSKTPSKSSHHASASSSVSAAFGSVPSTSSVTNIEQFDLANGMTAGVGPEQQANPRLGYNNVAATAAGNPMWAPLRIGFMRSLPGYVPSRMQSPNSSPSLKGTYTKYPSGTSMSGMPLNPSSYYLFFLWNPNQVTAQMAMDPTQLPPIQYAGGIPLAPNSMTGQTISWTLVFDRTYDIVYDPNPGSNRGVLKDVAALYNMLGTFASGGSTPYLVPIQVVFGVTGEGDLWGFTGYVTNFTVSYGIFKSNMIPSRCEVAITMLARYIPQSLPSGSSTAKHPSVATSAVGSDYTNNNGAVGKGAFFSGFGG